MIDEQPTPEQAADEQITLTGDFAEVPNLNTGQEQPPGAPQELAAAVIPWNPDVARALAQSVSNIPAMIYGDHLIRTPEHVECVVMPLYELGRKYGFANFPFMAELAFICAAGAIAGGIYRDHKEYKKTHGDQTAQKAPDQQQPAEAESDYDKAVGRI